MNQPNPDPWATATGDDLAGKSYVANDGRIIRVVGPDDLMPGLVLLEDEAGNKWSCHASLVRDKVASQEPHPTVEEG